MKKIVGILAAAALIAGSATVALAGQAPGTGVVGSMHDMNVSSGGSLQQDDMQRVCIFCHTPHNANMGGEVAGTYPLWNHTLPDTTGWQNYVFATPANQDPSIDTSDPLIGPSRLCMSCHDGVIAPDQHGGAISQAGTNPMTGEKAIGAGKDLTDDHPIGFSYNNALAIRGTSELALTTDTLATSIDTTTGIVTRASTKPIGDLLFNGDVVTCASCHEVHNKNNVANPSASLGTANYFLWAPEKDSLNCLTCHKK